MIDLTDTSHMTIPERRAALLDGLRRIDGGELFRGVMTGPDTDWNYGSCWACAIAVLGGAKRDDVRGIARMLGTPPIATTVVLCEQPPDTTAGQVADMLEALFNA